MGGRAASQTIIKQKFNELETRGWGASLIKNIHRHVCAKGGGGRDCHWRGQEQEQELERSEGGQGHLATEILAFKAFNFLSEVLAPRSPSPFLPPFPPLK